MAKTPRGTPKRKTAGSAQSSPKPAATLTDNPPVPPTAQSDLVVPPLPPAQPKPTLIEHVFTGLRVFGIIILSSLASYYSQKLLHPLFSRGPTTQYHQLLLMAAIFPSSLLPLIDTQIVLGALASVCAVAPIWAYLVGGFVARSPLILDGGRPEIGVVLVQLGMVVPISVLAINLMKRWMPAQELEGTNAIRAAFTTFAGLRSMDPIWQSIIPNNEIFNACNAMPAIAIALTSMSILSPTPPAPGTTPTASPQKSAIKLALISIPLALLALPRLAFPSSSGIIRLSSCAPYVHDAASRFNVLESRDSLTGLIVVGEEHTDDFTYRYLRCDHSLLGGQWVQPPASAGKSLKPGETIYSAFRLPQAVKLVDRKHSSAEAALVIGLGVGILPSALHSYGIAVTVLEVDPIIPPFAREHFGFPSEITTTVTEGRAWIKEHATQVRNGTLPGGQFDYVVQDVFTGGALPSHLFTVDMWQETKELMKEDGVLAVNFAGTPGSNVARAIFITLLQVFPTCRAFHGEELSVEGQPIHTDLKNIVIFCTSQPALTFRSPSKADFLDSEVAKALLTSLASREVTPEAMKGRISENLVEDDWVVTDKSNALEKWSTAEVLAHWKVMRHVMPSEGWEAY